VDCWLNACGVATRSRAQRMSSPFATRSVEHPISIGSALLILALGSLNYPLMPLIVGAITDHLGIPPNKAGWIATADTLGMFLASLSALYWARRVNWRHAGLFLGTSLVVAHTVSAFCHSLGPLLIARLAAGYCGGSMMALGNVVIGDTKTRERNVALFNIIQMGIVWIAFLIMPLEISRFGATGAFLFMALYVSPALIISFFLPKEGVWPRAHSEVKHSSASSIAWVIGGTLPVFFFFLAYGASWTYMERIGVAAGLSHAAVGGALSASIFAAIVGSVVSWFYATRYGNVRPLLLTLVCQLISLGILLFYLNSVTAFTVAVMIYFLFINFAGPYQIGVALNVDHTGRGAIIFLLMLKAGVTVGPFVASNFVSNHSFAGPIVISIFFFTLSFLFSWLVTRAARASGTFPLLSVQPAT
jgi:MFS transporter, DHA1 family, inner membrane transport protein